MDYSYTQSKAVKRGILGGLAGILTLIGSGCETLNVDDANAVLWGNLARTTPDRNTASLYRSVSQISAIEGQRTYQNKQNELNRQTAIEAANIMAQAERDSANTIAQQNTAQQPPANATVNNIVANTPQEKTWENSPKFFAYLNYKDFNNNGFSDRDEFIGEGNVFYQNQQIDFLANMSGKISGYELFDENGKSIIKLESPTEERRQIHTCSPNPAIMKPGNYVAVWSIDGKFAGKTEVKILERIVSQNNKPQEKTWSNSPKFFACTGLNDFNNNGFPERDEYIGEGNVFYKDQKVKFIGEILGKLVKYQFIDEDGRSVIEQEQTLLAPSITSIEQTMHKPGNYVAVWSIDGKVAGKTEVKIIERNTGEKNESNKKFSNIYLHSKAIELKRTINDDPNKFVEICGEIEKNTDKATLEQLLKSLDSIVDYERKSVEK